jgi:hypothetical protein
LERCVWRDRRFGGISALWGDFSQWATVQKSVFCNRQIFERLLAEAGFLYADGLISGLMLKADLWAFEPRPSIADGVTADENEGQGNAQRTPQYPTAGGSWLSLHPRGPPASELGISSASVCSPILGVMS